MVPPDSDADGVISISINQPRISIACVRLTRREDPFFILPVSIDVVLDNAMLFSRLSGGPASEAVEADVTRAV
jgi:hypothetical protein